jgi:hypothetical protein
MLNFLKKPSAFTWAFGMALLPMLSYAAGPIDFSVSVDRHEISQDDSLALKFQIKLEGTLEVEGPPSYNAPDFDLVNEYTNVFMESYYENGRFGVRNTQSFTRVLRPKRAGTFKIDRLQARVDGQLLQAAPITVHVTAGGAGTPPPRGYGGGGVGLRGAGKRPPQGAGFFVRAELDKSQAYKGEQVVVSYYLYRRVRVFNIQVDKYPVLGGFLREDLEMPVLGQRLDSEQVMLDGVPYERSLLTRYAAYPLKEGKLPIDSMMIKANYYAAGPVGGEDDPFASFFQQMAPRQGTSTSDAVSIEVLPLPQQGKPASFTGGIGSFDLSATADKPQLRAGEAVTLTLKVEGKGNFSAVEAPKLSLPAGVELYESKSQVRGGKAGVGEKLFTFLLIPREVGRVTLPPVEMSFFNPSKKTFETRVTPSIPIEVLTGDGTAQALSPKGASTSAQGAAQGSAPGSQSSAPKELRPWKSAEDALGYREGGGAERIALGVAVLGLFAAAAIGGRGLLRRGRGLRLGLKRPGKARSVDMNKSWSKLEDLARRASQGSTGMPFNEVIQAYEQLCGAIYDALDRKYGVGARSLARADLRGILIQEKGLPEPIWESIALLLEQAEKVRFATGAGFVAESEARSGLIRWVQEGRQLDEAMARAPEKVQA